MFKSKEDVLRLFDGFTRLKVLIIGDVMVDAYLFGKVERISPEAPVPVVSVQKRKNLLGGAANVALNIKALGATPVLCSVIGDDLKGKEFLSMMHEEALPISGILQSSHRVTTAKFRIIGNKAQIVRVDEEMTDDLSPEIERDFLKAVLHILDEQKIDVILFQDYNKGVLTPAIIHEVIGEARMRKIPTAVDPKKKNFGAYKQVTLFKPNLKELSEGLRIDLDASDTGNMADAAVHLHNEQEIDHVFITISEYGVFISSRHDKGCEVHTYPAHVRRIADVSGAGDTVISLASLLLAMNRGADEIAFVSNLAGGLVCEEVGVVPVNLQRLFDEVVSCLVPE